MGGRRGRSQHGVEVKRRATSGPGQQRASQVRIRRICIRYEDGRRVCFVPEAGEEFFSQDDAHKVVGLLHIGSEALEWELAREGRYPGTGPYDTGAV
jgi:hypothetical protein